MREYVLFVILIFIPIGMALFYFLRREGLSSKDINIIILLAMLIIFSFPISMERLGVWFSIIVYLLVTVVLVAYLLRIGEGPVLEMAFASLRNLRQRPHLVVEPEPDLRVYKLEATMEPMIPLDATAGELLNLVPPIDKAVMDTFTQPMEKAAEVAEIAEEVELPVIDEAIIKPPGAAMDNAEPIVVYSKEQLETAAEEIVVDSIIQPEDGAEAGEIIKAVKEEALINEESVIEPPSAAEIENEPAAGPAYEIKEEVLAVPEDMEAELDTDEEVLAEPEEIEIESVAETEEPVPAAELAETAEAAEATVEEEAIVEQPIDAAPEEAETTEAELDTDEEVLAEPEEIEIESVAETEELLLAAGLAEFVEAAEATVEEEAIIELIVSAEEEAETAEAELDTDEEVLAEPEEIEIESVAETEEPVLAAGLAEFMEAAEAMVEEEAIIELIGSAEEEAETAEAELDTGEENQAASEEIVIESMVEAEESIPAAELIETAEINKVQLEEEAIIEPISTADEETSAVIESLAEEEQTATEELVAEPEAIEEAEEPEENGELFSPVADFDINHLIDLGFQYKASRDFAAAIRVFTPVWQTVDNGELKYLLTMELVDLLKECGDYYHAEEILGIYLELGGHKSDIIYEISRQLDSIRFLATELTRLGMSGAPWAQVPRWIRMELEGALNQ